MKTNAIEQWIKDAIEGGYTPKEYYYFPSKVNPISVLFKGDDQDTYEMSHHQMLLQPKAWQAVYKNDTCYHEGQPYRHVKCESGQNLWEVKWHQFIDLLADGHDINSSLNEIE